jgi:hypothetical protein
MVGGGESESHAVDEVEPRPIGHDSHLGLFFGSERDDDAEDPLEAVDTAAMLLAGSQLSS